MLKYPRPFTNTETSCLSIIKLRCCGDYSSTIKLKCTRLHKFCYLEAEYVIMRGIININFRTKKILRFLIEHMKFTNEVQSSSLILLPHEVLLCPSWIVCSCTHEAHPVIDFD